MEPFVAVEHALTRFLRQATRPAVGRWLTTVSGVTMDRAVYAALARIDETEPIRPTELAEILGIDLSAVSRQVRDLVQSALVERTPDAADQRACRLRLTDDGRALLGRVRQARQDAFRELLEGWSDADQRTLARLVARLADTMETRVSHDSPLPQHSPVLPARSDPAPARSNRAPARPSDPVVAAVESVRP
jgi:DNA-binding MarR family transcriptional regulator